MPGCAGAPRWCAGAPAGRARPSTCVRPRSGGIHGTAAAPALRTARGPRPAPALPARRRPRRRPASPGAAVRHNRRPAWRPGGRTVRSSAPAGSARPHRSPPPPRSCRGWRSGPGGSPRPSTAPAAWRRAHAMAHRARRPGWPRGRAPGGAPGLPAPAHRAGPARASALPASGRLRIPDAPPPRRTRGAAATGAPPRCGCGRRESRAANGAAGPRAPSGHRGRSRSGR